MYSRAMAQAVSRWPLTAEARVRSEVSPGEICGGETGTGTGFFPSTSVSLSESYTVALCSCTVWGMTDRPFDGCNSETFSPHRHDKEGDAFYSKLSSICA
jgi:hypothetical protein